MTNLSLKKTVCRLVFAAMIFSTMLLSSGCEKKTAASAPHSQSTPGSTKLLEAVDLVGYDGKRLRKSVDRIKETNEKHNQELEKMAGSGPDQYRPFFTPVRLPHDCRGFSLRIVLSAAGARSGSGLRFCFRAFTYSDCSLA